MAEYDVMVVGSGAGGLSAATMAARSGRSVLLLEAMPAFGGYLNPFRRKGYTFDTGLHYVGKVRPGEPFWRALEALGIHERVEWVELDPECIDRLIFPDYEFALCAGREPFKDALIATFPREERGIHRFFAVMDTLTAATRDPSAMMGGPLQMLGYLLKHPALLKYARLPYQTLLDEVTSDVRLQAVLAGQSGTYVLPPARASVLIALLVLDHYLDGAYYPKGGSGALRDALLNALHEQGAETVNRERVVGIDRRGGTFQIKTASGAEYAARTVISDADPAITLGQLADPRLVPARMRKRAARLRPSLSAYHAFVGTDLDLPALGMSSANIHRYESLDVNAVYERLDVSTLTERMPYCFVTSPSTKDPQGGHAPAGKHTLQIFCAARYEDLQEWAGLAPGSRGAEYEAIKEGIGRQLIRTAEGLIPGLSRHLDLVEYATPLSHEYWVNAVQGGLYGPEETADQMGLGRFVSFRSGIDGLYLAGAGTLGGGVNACIGSGIQAATLAIAYLEGRGS